MPTGQLEHVNITVTDPERSAKLFEQLIGWRERWRGPSQLGGWTIHVGDETTYLAVYTNERAAGGYAKGVPLNHVGLLVDDLDAAEAVVIEHGLVPFNHGDYEPGRRFYFFDWDGIEFEVVSYE
ncbi:VOC family protein [Parerythrobacter aurantius]|uniref:VOC family protein n=1 Tax=Parerythrobacter aurantius TaxID=3127706 RepID=UPI00324AAC63